MEIIEEQLSDFSGTRRSMLSKSHKDFRHSLVKGLCNLIVRFWLRSWITVVKTSTTILALEDLFWITSKQDFENFRRNFHSNQLNRWQWLCLSIIPRYYCICISPFASILSLSLSLYLSLCIQFCICWQMSCVKNKESTETHLAILICCKMRLQASCHDRWWVMALLTSSSRRV
jgi:ABC-type glycerol-3-phosphate transport system permease component